MPPPGTVTDNVYSWNIPNAEVGTETNFLTLKGTKKVNITAYIYTRIKDGEYPPLKFTMFKPNSTEVLKTLEIQSTGGNTKTATYDIEGEGIVNFQVEHKNWDITNTLRLTVNSIE